MIFQNIDFHNVDEITEENGEYVLHRIPASIEKYIKLHRGWYVNRCNVGIELRFVMKSDIVKLKFKASERCKLVPVSVTVGDMVHSIFDLYTNDFYITDEETELVLDKKKFDLMGYLDRTHDQTRQLFNRHVVRVSFNFSYVHFLGVEGEVEPPTAEMVPSKTLYAYGSSITSGQGARLYELGYCPITADYFGFDLVNKGYPGSCCIQKEVADYIATQKFDVGLFELGVNIREVGPEDFEKRLTYFLETVVPSHKEQKIFLISPFFMWDDYEVGEPCELYRKVFEKVLATHPYENLIYIDGLTLLHEPQHLQTDIVHPNIKGHALIAERLISIMEENL